jgi:mycofactocin glycosyltransferase
VTAHARSAPGRTEGPAPLPAGFRVELDQGTRRLTPAVLFGGAPARALRLSEAGCRALDELAAGPVSSIAAGVLGRKLTDAGLAHPRPPRLTPAAEVTVLIPVRDRVRELDRCLAAAGSRHRVVVVDDGSADRAGLAAVTARHGAFLVRRAWCGGPAAARNTGLEAVGTEYVALLDSDCVPPPGWIDALTAHFGDPLVAAAAPRIVALVGYAAGDQAAARYGAVCGSLDLGRAQARVVPGTRVSYVPTAALVVRRAALETVAEGRPVFDPALRVGEDVDLVWRLHDAGWRVRYDPSVEVPHDGPRTWSGLLSRRFHYGTSAAPLARRHPGQLAPLVLHPWPALAVAALLARRPAPAVAAAAASWLTMSRTLRRAGLPARGVAGAARTGIQQTWLGAGRYATQFGAPVVLAALVWRGQGSAARRLGRRAAVASLLLGPALDAWRATVRGQDGAGRDGPRFDPIRFVCGHIADDIAYGAGVWAGCARERTLAPLYPAVAWRPLRAAGLARSPAQKAECEGTGTDGQ